MHQCVFCDSGMQGKEGWKAQT